MNLTTIYWTIALAIFAPVLARSLPRLCAGALAFRRI